MRHKGTAVDNDKETEFEFASYIVSKRAQRPHGGCLCGLLVT